MQSCSLANKLNQHNSIRDVIFFGKRQFNIGKVNSVVFAFDCMKLIQYVGTLYEMDSPWHWRFLKWTRSPQWIFFEMYSGFFLHNFSYLSFCQVFFRSAFIFYCVFLVFFCLFSPFSFPLLLPTTSSHFFFLFSPIFSSFFSSSFSFFSRLISRLFLVFLPQFSVYFSLHWIRPRCIISFIFLFH